MCARYVLVCSTYRISNKTVNPNLKSAQHGRGIPDEGHVHEISGIMADDVVHVGADLLAEEAVAHGVHVAVEVEHMHEGLVVDGGVGAEIHDVGSICGFRRSYELLQIKLFLTEPVLIVVDVP